jgi:hypothetical protein
MPKCIDCANLKQLYLASRYCEGKTINAEDLKPEEIGILSNYDFECDHSDKDCLSQKEIHEERECTDFEPLETNSASPISDRDYAKKFGRLP